MVKKHKVYAALQWLQNNNFLYQEIIINPDQLGNWPNELIPTDIVDNILQCKDDNQKKERYAANLAENHHKDDFQAAMTETELHDSNTLSGCVYVDANNS